MPQPIDLQTEMARQTAVERVQEIAGRLSLAGLHRASLQDEEERVQQETQVQQIKETSSEAIHADGRRQNPFVGRRRKKKQDAANAADEKASLVYDAHERPQRIEDGEGRELDISI